LDAIYKAYHMPQKYTKGYHIADLLSDVIGRGKSSRLYEQLVKKEKMFNSLGAYVTGSLDPGLLVIHGKLNEGVSPEAGEAAIDRVLQEVKETVVGEEELQKVKNQAEATLIFSEVELLNRAMNLAFAALEGDPDYVNREPAIIQQVTALEVQTMANDILIPENCSTLYYKVKKDT
jgi:zinc protease